MSSGSTLRCSLLGMFLIFDFTQGVVLTSDLQHRDYWWRHDPSHQTQKDWSYEDIGDLLHLLGQPAWCAHLCLRGRARAHKRQPPPWQVRARCAAHLISPTMPTATGNAPSQTAIQSLGSRFGNRFEHPLLLLVIPVARATACLASEASRHVSNSAGFSRTARDYYSPKFAIRPSRPHSICGTHWRNTQEIGAAEVVLSARTTS
jgi:hypothetical protein